MVEVGARDAPPPRAKISSCAILKKSNRSVRNNYFPIISKKLNGILSHCIPNFQPEEYFGFLDKKHVLFYKEMMCITVHVVSLPQQTLDISF